VTGGAFRHDAGIERGRPFGVDPTRPDDVGPGVDFVDVPERLVRHECNYARISGLESTSLFILRVYIGFVSHVDASGMPLFSGIRRDSIIFPKLFAGLEEFYGLNCFRE
jgi:hypothetical protein